MIRTRVLRTYLGLTGVFLLFWWTLSHWFYPDWYHGLLGFQDYDPAAIKMIGTITVVPVLGIFFAAVDPFRNRDIITILIVSSILAAATYVYLILTGSFPVREYINVGICVVNALVLGFLFPRTGGKIEKLREQG